MLVTRKLRLRYINNFVFHSLLIKVLPFFDDILKLSPFVVRLTLFMTGFRISTI